ncbi:hypothetical protein N8829_01060 [bacterium]|nr:hypothetical protein [bacterium]
MIEFGLNDFVYIVKNDKLDLAMSAIENALVFASLDAASVDFKITISNDTRNKVLFKTVDSFVDGVPYDLNEFDLAPRAEINILSSDVAVGLFFKRGWYKLGEFYYLDGTSESQMSQLSTADNLKLFSSPREIGVRLGSGR